MIPIDANLTQIDIAWLGVHERGIGDASLPSDAESGCGVLAKDFP